MARSGTTAAFPGFIPPALATARDRPPFGSAWVHELKLDGYRLQAHIRPDQVQLLTRTGLDWTARFESLASAVDRAVGFVPGAAGIAISSLQTLDSFTTQTLDMDPEETAAFNRARLEKLEVPEGTIKTLLLNGNLTPTEKTLVVGYLAAIPGKSARNALASFVAGSVTRHGAFAALLTLSYVSAPSFADEGISNIEVIDGIPVLGAGANKKIAIFTSDDLAWTPSAADQLSKLGDVLKGGGKGAKTKEIRISGNATALAYSASIWVRTARQSG